MPSAAAISTVLAPPLDNEAANAQQGVAAQRKANRVRWLKLNFTVQAARLQTMKRQKYQHLQEEALLKARGLLTNWENNAVVLTEDLYRLAAGEREAAELMNYTPEALALRFGLRNDPSVLDAVKQLWRIDMPRDALGCIDQRGYASVFRRIAKSLDAKAFRKKQKVDKLLDEDWKRDSKGEPTMSFANFFDSIFELADLWCETIDADDYVAFLHRLRDRVSHVRRGKRAFKPLPKVAAFDADSDDDEDEEDEDDEEEESEEDVKPAPPPPQPPVAATPQAKILVAKAIKPVVQPLQQQPATTTLRKVSRVAISSSKALHRKEPVAATTVKPVASTPQPVAVAVVAQAQSLLSSPVASGSEDAMTPLATMQQPTAMPMRQRRASVVTTIQFLDNGFVQSISENISGGSGVSKPLPVVSAALSPAVTAAFASANARREQGLRLSLASAAAAALAKNDDPAISYDARQSTSSQQETSSPLTHQSSERKRVITVTTVKHAVLKSVVFATRRAGHKPPNDDPLETASLHSDLVISEETACDVTMQQQHELPVGIEPRRSRGTQGGANTAAAVPIRIQSGSLFDLDNDKTVAPNANGTGNSRGNVMRLGLGKTAAGASTKRGRGGGLVPLASPIQPGIGGSTNYGTMHQRNTLTAIPHGTSGPSLFSGPSSNGGIDFSDSVVMTNYVVERPSAFHGSSPLRAPTILGGHGKKPALSTIPQAGPGTGSQSAGIHGTRALAKPSSSPQVEQKETELAPKAKPIVVVVTKSPSPTHPPPVTLEAPHRYQGSAFHGTLSRPQALGHVHAPATGTSATANGDPEHALRIKAALDRDHIPVRGKDALVHAAVPTHERYYGHTDPATTTRVVHEPDRHGITIQSLPSGTKPYGVRAVQSSLVKIVPPQQLFMDPIATPWDTFDDDDDERDARDGDSSASSARSLLQPENAMEALAKVISKRAASLSAGSSRRSRHQAPSAPSSASSARCPSRQTEIDPSAYDNDDEVEISDGGQQMQVPRSRSRLLTVASLGGSTVEAMRHGATINGRLGRRGSRDEYPGDDKELESSASAPVLPTTTQLELDYVRQQPAIGRSLKPRSQSGAGATPLIKLPVRGHGHRLESIDDLELRGETAVDPSLSPPRSPVTTSVRTSPIKVCTCSHRRGPENGETDSSTDASQSWPPAVYRLDRSANEQDHSVSPESPDQCAACQQRHARERERDASDPTIIVNATRELFLEPTTKEQDVSALAGRETPTRSEMMRRRHRYTRGKPR